MTRQKPLGMVRPASKNQRRQHKMTEDIASRRDMANAIRARAMDAVQQADSGHPGMPMGMADVATVLFTKFLKFDPRNPKWPDRDRFVLSAGHGSMLLYSLLQWCQSSSRARLQIAANLAAAPWCRRLS